MRARVAGITFITPWVSAVRVPSPEDIRFALSIRKDAIIAEYTVKTTVWQGVQNAGLAIAGISLAGFVTRSLSAPSALGLGVAGALLALAGIVFIRLYGKVFHRRIKELLQQNETLKPED